MNPITLQQQQDDTHTKKRTRVTPTQLSILEDTFSVSATPDSKMRKQLAQKLQMPERSIQIWFQNRRAKVKMIQRREEQEMNRAKMYADAAASGTLLTPSSLSPSFWHGLPIPPPPPPSALMSGYLHQHPITKLPIQRSWSSDSASTLDQIYHCQPRHAVNVSSFYANSSDDTLTKKAKEPLYCGNLSPSPTPNPSNEHIKTETFVGSDTITDSMTINASAITIGTWHRMKINDQDLSCYSQPTARTFEWYIRDSDYHFKMVIPYDLVTSMDITILDQGIFAQVDMMISDPPLFYMENKDDYTWIQCSDFTEGMQATCHLRHIIRALASDLRQGLLGDPHLCQITRFPLDHQPISSDLSLGMTTLDTYSFMSSWRHQSLPLSMKDFEWSHQPPTTL